VFVGDLFAGAFVRDRLCSGHVTVPHGGSMVRAFGELSGMAKVKFLSSPELTCVSSGT
jgi:hypothetical protein